MFQIKRTLFLEGRESYDGHKFHLNDRAFKIIFAFFWTIFLSSQFCSQQKRISNLDDIVVFQGHSRSFNIAYVDHYNSDNNQWIMDRRSTQNLSTTWQIRRTRCKNNLHSLFVVQRFSGQLSLSLGPPITGQCEINYVARCDRLFVHRVIN